MTAPRIDLERIELGLVCGQCGAVVRLTLHAVGRRFDGKTETHLCACGPVELSARMEVKRQPFQPAGMTVADVDLQVVTDRRRGGVS